MGLHARMLAAGSTALVTTLVAASAAAGYQSVVRVESATSRYDVKNAFVNRVAVDTPATGVTITDSSDPLNPSPATTTCGADSPVAALIAAVGAAQVKTIKDPATGHWLVSWIKSGLAQPALALGATKPAWFWRIYADQAPIDNDTGGPGIWNANDACTSKVPEKSEVLLYPACGAQTNACYTGTPLYMRIRDGGPYDVAPQTVPGRGAPVLVYTIGDMGVTGATVETDEGVKSTSQATGPLAGQTSISFAEFGPHAVFTRMNSGARPPARMSVCVSEGADGFCGSTKATPPPEIPYAPSPCDTNGHDGLCGTVDTSGPVTHVTNIKDKQTFKKKKGPGRVVGTVEVDPNAVKDVKLRLTRVTTQRVLVKPKKKSKKKKAKKRYRTVKRCTVWDDSTALLETIKCGRKGKWFQTDLDDLKQNFKYDFALALPAGTYTLEVMSHDENGSPDAVTPGRNVLTFKVL